MHQAERRCHNGGNDTERRTQNMKTVLGPFQFSLPPTVPHYQQIIQTQTTVVQYTSRRKLHDETLHDARSGVADTQITGIVPIDPEIGRQPRAADQKIDTGHGGNDALLRIGTVFGRERHGRNDHAAAHDGQGGGDFLGDGYNDLFRV
mmetsp:Transcript_4969/g.7792  ORF Transcript_4969/g.7792 Transcript_4969/m.7792 type:complete len:148 (+) Transcript_4969:382-825(+)